MFFSILGAILVICVSVPLAIMSFGTATMIIIDLLMDFYNK